MGSFNDPEFQHEISQTGFEFGRQAAIGEVDDDGKPKRTGNIFFSLSLSKVYASNTFISLVIYFIGYACAIVVPSLSFLPKPMDLI